MGKLTKIKVVAIAALIMQTYTLSEARNRHGEIFDRATVEPVLLTKQSRPSHVLLSATAYQNLLDKLAELEDAVWGNVDCI